MKKGLSCREAFTAELENLARADRRIVALTSDARGSTALAAYAEALPEQFVEVGIAEQNEVGIAAGLAAVGYRPYVCAPASFMSARALEQIKVDVVYSRMNVKIFAVSGGVSYGALGFSHHSLHDIAVLRTFPGLRLVIPCDEVQMIGLLRALEKSDQPAYIRAGKAAMPLVYAPGTEFEVGKAVRLRDGGDATIVACGEMVAGALAAADALAAEGVQARVLDMHTLHPLDAAAVAAAARETGRIVTVEEHSVNGGLGAAVAQIVANHHPVPVRTLGFPDEFPVAGGSGDVFRHYGLDAAGIAAALRRLLPVRDRER
jgi:transketolase